jgi:hypothetical protein
VSECERWDRKLNNQGAPLLTMRGSYPSLIQAYPLLASLAAGVQVTIHVAVLYSVRPD